MLESFFIVGQQVVVLFLLIFLGYFCSKAKLLNQPTISGITNLVLYIVTPCILITSFQREFDVLMLGNLGIALLIATGFHLLNILFAHLFVHDPQMRRQRVLRFGVIFSNAGYMSLPLQDAILGADGVFYGAAVIAVFNLLAWTYGLVLMGGDIKLISLRNLVLNPGVTGVSIGLVLFLLSINLPYIIKEPMQMMAALNTPLPMLVIGFYLAESQIVHVLTDLNVYLVLFLRLLAVPLIMLAIVKMAGVTDHTMIVACVIAASAPCAAMTTMFASKFNQDTELSVGIVSFSTIVSIVTMPLVVGTARFLTL
jgi:predicted permease